MKLGNENLKEVFLDGSKNHFYVKDESVNPSGSVKDIPVYYILSSLKKDGTLTKDSVVIEATSGNTGIGLAYFQKEFGYQAIIVLPASASQGRKDLIKKYGATLVEVNGGGMKACKEKVRQLLAEIPHSFEFNQFNQPLNVESHIVITAPQIEKSLANPDYIFAGIGTGGTVTGVSKYFHDKGNPVQVIGVEPTESPLITKGTANPHKIEGIGANFIPSIFSQDYLADVVTVSYQEALEGAKILHKQGFFVGVSAGAALKAAYNYSVSHNLTNKKIVVILPDKGDRYQW